MMSCPCLAPQGPASPIDVLWGLTSVPTSASRAITPGLVPRGSPPLCPTHRAANTPGASSKTAAGSERGKPRAQKGRRRHQEVVGTCGSPGGSSLRPPARHRAPRDRRPGEMPGGLLNRGTRRPLPLAASEVTSCVSGYACGLTASLTYRNPEAQPCEGKFLHGVLGARCSGSCLPLVVVNPRLHGCLYIKGALLARLGAHRDPQVLFGQPISQPVLVPGVVPLCLPPPAEPPEALTSPISPPAEVEGAAARPSATAAPGKNPRGERRAGRSSPLRWVWVRACWANTPLAGRALCLPSGRAHNRGGVRGGGVPARRHRADQGQGQDRRRLFRRLRPPRRTSSRQER